MRRSSAWLACMLTIGSACKGEDDEWSKACESVATVADSWMHWQAAVGEYGHHYRYVREVQLPGIAAPSYCLYTTTIEVDGDVVLSRELALFSSSGDMPCEDGWLETGDEVGMHTTSAAAPAHTLEAVYEDCCVMINPEPGYFSPGVVIGSHSLISYCGDDWCDDGGCSNGPLRDIQVRSIEFLE